MAPDKESPAGFIRRDASASERKKDVAKYFFEYALPECKKMHDLAVSGQAHLLEKKEEILRGKN